jgi:hypothetical protein
MREGGDVKATFRNKKTKSISLFVWKENEKSNKKKRGEERREGKKYEMRKEIKGERNKRRR